MLLEIATTVGALSGAMLATHVPVNGLAIAFGVVLLYSAYMSRHSTDNVGPQRTADPLATRLELDSAYPTRQGLQTYHVRRVPAGFALMYVAGILSGLLGIGSGAAKVLAMDQVMQLPFKVATATSNFMIGVTAAAGAGVYLRRGYVDPGLVMPVALGVLAGAIIGARMLNEVRTPLLRNLFTWVIVVLALEMLYDGLNGML